MSFRLLPNRLFGESGVRPTLLIEITAQNEKSVPSGLATTVREDKPVAVAKRDPDVGIVLGDDATFPAYFSRSGLMLLLFPGTGSLAGLPDLRR